MKKITILNGITDEKYINFEDALEKINERNQRKFSCECFTLRKININYCCGCWNCWVKTPGECTQKDEMPKILRSIINSDLTVFISPILMGFSSSYLKKATDKLLPLLHPYIGIYENECHHKERYDRYPKLGLMLLDDKTNALSDLSIITDIYKRISVNMRSELAFTCISAGNVEVLENEINRV
ncbi:MAG: NAD(P)H-dependent oxidoreductase [Clostridia bacterium]|nr:NAD(P)H-dependent oxidoreductase [Clostridia bacterium]